MFYPRVLAEVSALPWAIEPAKGREVAAFLSRKANGEDIPAAEVLAAVARRKEAARPKPAAGVGLVPIYGVMTQRAGILTDFSGGTSTEQVGQWLDQLAADPAVATIVLDIDSPGGSVFGTAELGDKVASIGQKKKVIAVANSLAASAAYWIAAQSGELVITPGGQIGSIGVFQMHVDRSEELRQAGQSVTLVSAGERKTATTEFAPLGQAGREELQRGVDDYYGQFVRAVARGRKTTQTAVREGFGRGGMVRADQAVREGMADRVGTLESVLGRLGYGPADLRAEAGPAAPTAKPFNFELELRKRKMLLN